VGDTVSRLSRLRQSIPKWAFEGKLVDQDPTDEPASVLLERIKAERAAAAPTSNSLRPRGNRWRDLANPQMEGVRLEQHYRDTLAHLGKQGGMLGLSFEKAQNKIQDPANTSSTARRRNTCASKHCVA
jgi:hypothetical protein